MIRRGTIALALVAASCLTVTATEVVAQRCEAVSWVSAAPDRGKAVVVRADRPWSDRSLPSGVRRFDATAPAIVFPQDPSLGGTETVTLARLAGDGTRLDGRYARVSSGVIDGGLPIPGIDGQADFRFPFFDSWPECGLDAERCARFDAANAYWHIDRVATQFWRDRLGVDPPFQADVIVHLAGDGARTDPATNRILVGLGAILFRNGALEDDLLYHEYAHLAMASLGFLPDIQATTDARAVAEGYADYLAATFTDDPALGEYVRVCPSRHDCEGPPDENLFRLLDTDPAVWNWNDGHPDPGLRYGVCTRFHEGDGKCKIEYVVGSKDVAYVYAMIWGSALWDLRTTLGPDVFDFLVLDAIRMDDGISSRPGRALLHLLAADTERFDGAHWEIMESVMAERGIFPEGDAGVEPGPPPDGHGLRVFPNPAGGRVTVTFDASPGPHRLRLFDMSGRQVREWRQWIPSPGRHRSDVELRDLPAGVYLVELTGPRERLVARLVARPH